MKFFIPLILGIILFFLLTCCSANLSNTTADELPENNLSFQNHILPILKNTCGLSYCHGEVAPQGGVQIYDYYTLVTSYNGALIIPGNPDGSVLVQIIENRLPHNPVLNWKLTQNHIRSIRKWILEGAKNN